MSRHRQSAPSVCQAPQCGQSFSSSRTFLGVVRPRRQEGGKWLFIIFLAPIPTYWCAKNRKRRKLAIYFFTGPVGTSHPRKSLATTGRRKGGCEPDRPAVALSNPFGVSDLAIRHRRESPAHPRGAVTAIVSIGFMGGSASQSNFLAARSDC